MSRSIKSDQEGQEKVRCNQTEFINVRYKWERVYLIDEYQAVQAVQAEPLSIDWIDFPLQDVKGKV